jgi:hypothetical protein
VHEGLSTLGREAPVRDVLEGAAGKGKGGGGGSGGGGEGGEGGGGAAAVAGSPELELAANALRLASCDESPREEGTAERESKIDRYLSIYRIQEKQKRREDKTPCLCVWV